MIRYDELVLSDRVNGRLYYDPAVFEEELERIWYRDWIYVAHESEVPAAGDFVARRIGLQPVIVSRDHEGRVNVFLNRCSHRGNTVCQAERGNSGKGFRCVYHGWTFDAAGGLVAMPYAAGYDKSTFERGDFALGRVPRIASHRGFLFASMSPSGPTLAERLGRASALLDQFVDLAPEREIVVKGGVLRHAYQGNWKMALENSVDGYHPNILHHAGLMLMSKNRGVNMEEIFGERADARARDLGGGAAQLDFSVVNRKHDGRSVPPAWSAETQREYAESMARAWGPERAKEIVETGPPHFCIFPNLIFILNQIRVVEPIAADRTVVRYYPTLLKGAPAELNLRRLAETYQIHGPAGYVAPDDFEAYERNQIGFQARANEWLVLRRGLHREERESSGALAGHETDETTQRGIWRHYREVMAAQ